MLLSKAKSLDEVRKDMLLAMSKDNKDELVDIFKEYIELMKFALIKDDMFYGMFASNFNNEISFDIKQAFASSIVKENIMLYCNPAIICMYSHREILALLKHEILHFINQHISRKKEMEGMIGDEELDLAADVAINQLINDLPNHMITLNEFCDRFQLNVVTAERKQSMEYYANLIKTSQQGNNGNGNNKSNSKNEMVKDAMKNINDMNNKLEKNSNSMSNKEIKDIEKKIKEMVDKMGTDHSTWNESNSSDIQNMENIVKNLINDSAMKCKGNIPSEIQELIKILNQKAIISWQDEFRHIVGSVKCPYKRTMLRRQRRSPQRYDLKGKISDRKVRVCVAIDTSASVGQSELAFIFNEIFGILETIKFELFVIECDAAIQRVYAAKDIKEVDLSVQGRGGTAFQPVFQYIKEEMYSFDKKPDVLIYFTDGYGERHIDERFKPVNYKVIWVLTDKSTDLSVDNPFTSVIKELDMNGKNKRKIRKF